MKFDVNSTEHFEYHRLDRVLTHHESSLTNTQHSKTSKLEDVMLWFMKSKVRISKNSHFNYQQ